jgi:DNA adenine methylase
MKSLSPLRYPGGKTALYEYIVDIINLNDLDGHTFVELFAGGAGLSIALLLNQKVKNIVLNEYDYSVYSFWHSVLSETDALCKLINDTIVTTEKRLELKEVYKEPRKHTKLELGFASLFLNRTNRSGILNAGVIGGNDQSGNYLIDCRFNKKQITQKIITIAKLKDKINLFNLDGKVFLETKKNILKEKPLLFLDPPYVAKGPCLYDCSFLEEEHIALYLVMETEMMDGNWVITYDNVPLIQKLYRKFSKKPYKLTYSAYESRRTEEIMIFAPKLKIPINPITKAGR